MHRRIAAAAESDGHKRRRCGLKKAKWVSVLAVVCMLMALLPATAWADAAGTGGSTVESVVDAATWYGDQTTACDTLDSFWNDQVTEAPSTYVADDSARTVSLGDAAALVWWARLVNQGTSFAGYTVNLTADADLSAHYWTPICTGTVSYTAAGDCNIADSQTLEGVTFNGNGHTITGLTTQTGVRGAQQDSRPGDGQNSYSDAAFIGYNCCDLTLENLTFAGARIAISQPWEEITQIYGSSMLAVVVGRQNGGSLTLQNVAVRGASVLAMQKAAALVGDLAGNAMLKVSQCEISDSRISAYFMAAPIVGYAKSDQVEVSGIRLARNTIHVSEQDSSACALDPVTGAQYYGGALNASATALFYDGATDTGQGHELDLVAEAAGYAYPTLTDAVQAVVNAQDKTGTVTLLKDAAGSGVGLLQADGALDVNLTIDFGGHTYTCTAPAGSSGGAENPGFRLEAGNTVTLQNGTVAVSQEAADITTLIANSSNLTLQDLNLQGAGSTRCLLSGDSGEMVMSRVNADGTADDLAAIALVHRPDTLSEGTVPTLAIHNTKDHVIRGTLGVYGPEADTPAPESASALTIDGGAYSEDPSDYLGAGLIAVPADGLFRVQTYEPDVLLSGLPPVDPDREEVQAGMTSDSETLLAAQTEQLLVDVLGSQNPAGVDEETAARVEDAIRQLQPITVEVQFSREGISPEDRTAAQKILEDGDTLARFFDLSLVLKSGDTELGKLTRLSSPLRISVFLPESLVQADRTFFLVRVHEGVAEKLPAAFDAASAALTFDTDRFSTYALGYTDPPAPQPAEEAPPSGSGGSSSDPTDSSADGSSGNSDGSASVNVSSSSSSGNVSASTASTSSGNTAATATSRAAAPAQPASAPASPAGSSGIPQTSDPSHPMLWWVLFCLSGAGLAAAAVCRFRQKYTR